MPGEPLNLTPEMAFYLGAAFADMLAQQLGKPASKLRVSVGPPRLNHIDGLCSPLLAMMMPLQLFSCQSCLFLGLHAP